MLRWRTLRRRDGDAPPIPLPPGPDGRTQWLEASVTSLLSGLERVEDRLEKLERRIAAPALAFGGLNDRQRADDQRSADALVGHALALIVGGGQDGHDEAGHARGSPRADPAPGPRSAPARPG